ncbi:MAG: hypothetical protein ACP5E3_18665, partial [Bacteroidales bacterium]
MDFLNTQQISSTDLTGENYDLFITVAGDNNRCTHLIKSHNISAVKKICFTHSEKGRDLFKKSNSSFFTRKGFEIVGLSSQGDNTIFNLLEDFLNASHSDIPRILIDYSCMPKGWYATIIQYFFEIEKDFESIELFFSYSPSKFYQVKRFRRLKNLKEDFERITLTDSKPTALILSLGIETGRAEQLVKYLKPDQLVILYADPAIDPTYVKNIFSNNKVLLDKTEPRNIINYPLLDIDALNEILTSKCMELRMDYNLVIAPLGPKVFTLNSFFLASRFPDIMVLDSKSGQTSNPGNVEPAGQI